MSPSRRWTLYLKSALEQTLLDVFSVIDRNVLYVSHDIDEACRLCDRICVMHNGRIEESGTAHELLARPQTLAGMRLTGCKNTSRARRVSATEVEALDWGMTFDVGREVPSDVAYVGVRARTSIATASAVLVSAAATASMCALRG